VFFPILAIHVTKIDSFGRILATLIPSLLNFLAVSFIVFPLMSVGVTQRIPSSE